jgi:hypothetical protein
MKSVVITQSNYIPWKGYFDQIRSADNLVFYDDAQFTRRDWRNRNRIKTANGPVWLSIPVEVKGKFSQKIKDTRIADTNWATKHWKSIQFSYSKAAHFKRFSDQVEDLYQRAGKLGYLSEVNALFIQEVCSWLGITAEFSWSSEYVLEEGKTERLAGITEQLGANRYLSGPAAKAYMDIEVFSARGISVEYFDYSNYPVYDQLHGEFDHAVCIFDLLFSVGEAALSYMKDDCLEPIESEATPLQVSGTAL